MTAADDRLVDEILAVFPDAAEVTDDGSWTTICQGRFGALQVRHAPPDTCSTPADENGRRYVTGAEPV